MIFTWTVTDVPSVYSRERVTAVIERACDAWSKALSGKVRFLYLTQDEIEDEDADIVFSFAKVENPAWIAEHRKQGEVSLIRFRDTKTDGTPHTWAITWIERKLGLKDSCLLTSALHELGHALGAEGHVPQGKGCMEAQQWDSYTAPTKADVELILKHLKP